MSRRAGEVTLTPAMARQVWGWVFEGREHLHQGSAMLARFRRAGYGGPPQELPGQQRLMTGAGEPLEGVVGDEQGHVVSEYSSHAVTPAEEQAAGEQLVADNTAVAATHPERYVGVAGGVGAAAMREPAADPQDYDNQEQMHAVAAERAKRGHGVSAGTF